MLEWARADRLCRGDYARFAREADLRAMRESNPSLARIWGERAQQFISIYRRLDWVPKRATLRS